MAPILKMVLAILLSLCAWTTQAALVTFQASLVPEVAGATGSGTVTVVYDPVGETLGIEADWSGLSGPTTVAHIHCCTGVPGTGTVGVAVTPGTLPGFPVGTQDGTYVSPSIDLTDPASYTASFLSNFGGGLTAQAQAALVAGMQAGTAYFNIHSSTFPGGEIRGFLQPAPMPLPGSLLLAMLGMAALAIGTRRQR